MCLFIPPLCATFHTLLPVHGHHSTKSLLFFLLCQFFSFYWVIPLNIQMWYNFSHVKKCKPILTSLPSLTTPSFLFSLQQNALKDFLTFIPLFHSLLTLSNQAVTPSSSFRTSALQQHLTWLVTLSLIHNLHFASRTTPLLLVLLLLH